MKLTNDFTRKLTSLTKNLLKTNVIFVTIFKKIIILAIYDVDIHIVKRVVKKTFNDYNKIKESNDWIVYTNSNLQYNFKNLILTISSNVFVRSKKYDIDIFLFKKSKKLLFRHFILFFSKIVFKFVFVIFFIRITSEIDFIFSCDNIITNLKIQIKKIDWEKAYTLANSIYSHFVIS